MTPVVIDVVGAACVGAAGRRVAAIDVVTAMMARQREQRTRKPSRPAAATRLSGITYLARQLRQL
jgi:hypothetical protein